MCISLNIFTILYGAELPQDVEHLKDFEFCSTFKVALKDFCLVTVSNVSNNDVNRGFCFLIDDLQAIMLMRLVPTNIGFSLLVLLLTALWLPESKIQYRINRIQFYFECCDYGTFSWSIADKKKEIIVIDLCRRK